MKAYIELNLLQAVYFNMQILSVALLKNGRCFVLAFLMDFFNFFLKKIGVREESSVLLFEQFLIWA